MYACRIQTNPILKRAQIVTTILGGLWLLYYAICGVSISDYNAARDHDVFLQNFQEEIYWLLEEPAKFDPEYMLRTRSPRKDNLYIGQLEIKVLRECGHFAGFVTFYKSTFRRGDIQFVAVNKNFRCKGYGRRLTQYAIDKLFAKGCDEVRILTYLHNTPARRIYTELGFKETHRDEKFIYYVIRR